MNKGDLLVRQDTSFGRGPAAGRRGPGELARSDLERADKMLADKIISQSDYDKAVANLRAGPGPGRTASRPPSARRPCARRSAGGWGCAR